MRLTRTQEDAHREVLAIVEAITVVHRDAVAPYLEESILTLREGPEPSAGAMLLHSSQCASLGAP